MCLPYADNGVVSKRRPFLSIKEEDGFFHLLNVSSLKNKAHKLLIPSNVEIKKYNPPFKLPSMVKMDVLFKVEKCAELNKQVVSKGQMLDSSELERILELHSAYLNSNSVATVVTSATQLSQYLKLN